MPQVFDLCSDLLYERRLSFQGTQVRGFQYSGNDTTTRLLVSRGDLVEEFCLEIPAGVVHETPWPSDGYYQLHCPHPTRNSDIPWSRISD